LTQIKIYSPPKYIKGFKIGWDVYGFHFILFWKVTSRKKVRKFFETGEKKLAKKYKRFSKNKKNMDFTFYYWGKNTFKKKLENFLKRVRKNLQKKICKSF